MTTPRADRILNLARYHASWMLFFTIALIGMMFAAAIAYQNQSGLGILVAILGAILSLACLLHHESESRHLMHLYKLAFKRQMHL